MRYSYFAEQLNHQYMLPERLIEIQESNAALDITDVKFCDGYCLIVWRKPK